MRKYIKLFIILIGCFTFSVISVSASTNVKERSSSNNYLVPSGVEFQDSELDAIKATPAVDETEKIYDFAELYTSSEEKVLYDKVNEYIGKYKIDFVIVTINDNPMASSEDFTNAFYHYNNFGLGDKRDGIVFLMDMQNKQMYMLASGKAKALYEDGRKTEVLQSAVSYIRKKDYYQGTLNFINTSFEFAALGLEDEAKFIDKIPWFSLIVVSAIITVVTISVLVKKNKMAFKMTSSSEFLVKDNSKMKLVRDTFMGSNITNNTKQNKN